MLGSPVTSCRTQRTLTLDQVMMNCIPISKPKASAPSASEEPSEEKYERDKNEGKEELYAVLGIDSKKADVEYLYRPVRPDQPDNVFQKRILLRG